MKLKLSLQKRNLLFFESLFFRTNSIISGNFYKQSTAFLGAILFLLHLSGFGQGISTCTTISDLWASPGKTLTINGTTVSLTSGLEGTTVGSAAGQGSPASNFLNTAAIGSTNATTVDNNTGGWKDYIWIKIHFDKPTVLLSPFRFQDIDGNSGTNAEMVTIIGQNGTTVVTPTYIAGSSLVSGSTGTINDPAGIILGNVPSYRQSGASAAAADDDPRNILTADFGTQPVTDVYMMWGIAGTTTATAPQYGTISSTCIETTIPSPNPACITPPYKVYQYNRPGTTNVSNLPVQIVGATTTNTTLDQRTVGSDLTYNGFDWKLLASDIVPDANNKIDVSFLPTTGTNGTYMFADAILIDNGFNTIILDDNDPNFSRTGTWVYQGPAFSTAAYLGDNTYATPGPYAGRTATWSFTNLPTTVTPPTPVPLSDTIAYSCTNYFQDLTALVDTTKKLPIGYTYEWHSVASNPTAATLVPNPTHVTSSGPFYLYIMGPAGCVSLASAPVTGNTYPVCEDCDGDGVPNDADTDDDNDGVSDMLESTQNVPSTIKRTYYRYATPGLLTSGTTPGISTIFTGTGADGLPTAPTTGLAASPYNVPVVTTVTALQFISTSPDNTASASQGESVIFDAELNFCGHTNVQFRLKSLNDWDVNYLYAKQDTTIVGAPQVLSLAVAGTQSGLSTALPGNGPISLKFYHNDDFNLGSGEVWWKSDQSPVEKLLNVNDLPTANCYALGNIDTDNDGIPNTCDLDSDGDGCSDAVEAGNVPKLPASAWTSTTVYPATPPNTTTSISYTSFGLNSASNYCNLPDCDGDGIPNVADLDDDNDGVMDIVEENCPIALSTPYASVGASNFVQTTYGGGILVTSPGAGSVTTGTGAIGTNNFSINSNSLLNTRTATYSANSGTKNILDNYSANATISAHRITTFDNFTTPLDYSYRFNFVDIDLNEIGRVSAQDCSGNPLDMTQWTVEAGDLTTGYTVSSSTSQLSVTGTANNNGIIVFKSPFGVQICSITFDVTAPTANVGVPIFIEKINTSSCDNDIDGDGNPNSCDTDSDGDGCPDAVEAGILPIGQSVVAAPYGSNGLANSIENNDTQTATITSAPNYSLLNYTGNALSDTVNLCNDDCDKDGIPNVFDIDDDNDGVTDKTEMNCGLTQTWSGSAGVYTANITPDLKVKVTFTGSTWSGITPIANFARNCLDPTYLSDYEPLSNTGKPGLQFQLNNGSVGATFKVEYLNAANQPVTVNNPKMHLGGLGGSYGTGTIGSSDWTLTGGDTQTLLANDAVDFGATSTTIFHPRLFGAGSGVADCATGEGSATLQIDGPQTNYQYTVDMNGATNDQMIVLFEGCSEMDTDKDGKPNTCDLDSDGDGCSDAFESGATTDQTPNFEFSGSVGTNGLFNSIENMDTQTASVNYTVTYNKALDSTIKSCCVPPLIPSNLTATPSSICVGSSAVLSATCSSGTLKWATDLAFTTAVASTTVLPTVTTTYYARCENGGCNSPVASVIVTVNPIPATPTITPLVANICSGTSTSLTASGCEAGTVNWYIQGNPAIQATGNSYSASPTITTTYYATCTIGTCVSLASSPATVTVLTAPASPSISVSDNSICVGSSVTLTATSCTGTLNWFKDGNLIGTGLTLSDSPSASAVYTATCNGSGAVSCSTPANSTLNVTVNPIPAVPTVSPSDTICAGSSVQISATGCTGNQVTSWSNGQTGANISVSPTATTSYTAQCVDPISGCSSAMSVALKITVNQSPSTPPSGTGNPPAICVGKSSILTAGVCSVGTATWYLDSAMTTLLPSTTVSPITTTTYFVACVNGDCKSSAQPVIVNVIPTPPAPNSPAATQSSICLGANTTLNATCSKGAIKWFSDINLTTALNSNIVSPTISTIYYAACDLNGCLGSSVSLNITVTICVKSDTVVVTPKCPTCPTNPICPTADDLPTSGTPTYSNCGLSPIDSTKGSLTIGLNGCLIWTPNGTQTDTVKTCVIKCIGLVCDTTYIVIPPPIKPDTTFVTPTCPTCPTPPICATADDITVNGNSTFSMCPLTPTGQGTAVLDANNCLIFTPNGNQTDTVKTCIVACTNGVCDTTYIIIPPAESPKLSIVKGSALNLGTDGVATPGDIVTYSYDVTNIGNVTLTSVTVTENAAGFTGTGTLPAPTFVSSTLASPAGTLKVGEKATYSATYAITAADILAGKIDNSAFANGISPKGTAVKDTSDSKNPADYNESGIPSDPNGEDKTGTPIAESPKISIVKGSALNLGTDGVATPGDIVTYSYDVTNIGNVTLTSVTVTENAAGFTGTGTLPAPTFVSSTLASPVGTLKVGEKATYSATYAITAADILAGKIDNSAFANGISPKGTAVKDTSDSKNPADYNESGIPSDPNGEDKTGTPIAESPKLSIVKGSALNLGTDGVATPGDIVTYSYDVTNIGNVTLTSVTITENAAGFTGTGTLPAPTFVSSTLASPAGTLKVGEKATYSATYAITAADILAGKIDNSAFANGISPKGTAVKDTSDSKNPADYNETGVPSDPNGEDKTGTPIAESPKIAIVKGSALNLGTDGIANPGDIVTYSYDVTNIGNVTLTSVTVTENAAGFTGTGTLPAPTFVSSTLASPAGTLKVGEKATYSATYAITAADILAGKIDNSAFANGISPKGTAVKDTSDSKNPADYNESGIPSDPNGEDKTGTPIAESPKIAIVKGSTLNLGTDGVATLGDIVTYSYDVTNIGNVTLTSVTVTENAAGFTGTGTLPAPTFVSSTLASPAGTLKVGEKATYSATYAITAADILAGKIDNSAFANGISPKGTAVKDTSDSKNPADYNESGIPSDPNGEDKTGTPIAESPKIAIVKGSALNLGTDGVATPGDIVTYSYDVTNIGNVTLTSVTVTENAAGFTGTGTLPAPTFVSSTLASPAGTLKVGEKATYSATYAITAADILAGKIDNSAFANGISPKGTAVKDTSDSKNPADYNESGIPSDPNGEDKTGTPIAESPKLSIVKGSSLNLGTDGVATPGDIVTYSYDVTNIGNVTITSVTVTENAAGFTGTGTLPAPTFVSSTLASPAGTLKVGEKATYSATYAITAADILAGKIDNSAFANGISPKGTAVKDTSDSKNPADYNESGIPSDPNGEDKTGTPIAESPKLSIVKGSSLNLGTDGVATPGDIVTYSYDVTNIGNVTLTSVTVTENAAGFTGTGTLPAPTFVSSTLASPAGTLLVGEKATYSATYAITAADIAAGKIDNSAFANGISPKGTAVKDTSDSKNPADYNESGIPSDPNGEDKTGTPIAESPKLSIVKGSALNLGTDGVATPGDIVTYSYDVTNVGNVTLTSVTVTENAAGFTGTGTLPAPTFVSSTLASPAGTLKVGEKATYSATYAITAADILAGKIDNSAFANGISPKGTAVKDTSDSKNPADYNESGIPSDPNGEDKTGTPIAESPKIAIVKGSALNLGTDGVATPGDIVTYSYDVTNIGNVTLTSVTVTENAAGFTGTGTLPAPTFVSSTLASPAGTLKVGEKATYSATYAITAADILAGKIDNSAFANGISPKGTAVKDTSDSKNPADYNESGIPSDPNGEDKTGTPIAESPKIAIVKGSALNLGTDGVATPGDIVTYSYDVTNIGNVTLTSVTVTENAAGFSGTGTLPTPTFVSSTLSSPVGTLKVGEKATYSATYAITAADIAAGKIDNSAFANGISPKGTAVKDTSDSKNPADYNESGIPSDPNGEDKTGTPIENPSIAIVKGSSLNLGTNGVVNAGDIITYTYDVTNTGNVILSGVTATESATAFTGTGILPTPAFVSASLGSPSGTLKVGEKATYQALYAITAADITAGKIDNQAFTSGNSPKGVAVKDTSDSKNPADYNETGTPGTNPKEKDKTGTTLCNLLAATNTIALPADICVGQSSTLSASCASGTTTWYSNAALTQAIGGNVVAPIVTTTYYVACVSGACKSPSRAVTVNVSPIPSVPTNLTASPTTVCKGQSSTLGANCATGTPVWYFDAALTSAIGTNVVTPLVTTTYYVACENGICQSLSGQIAVNVTDTPSTPSSIFASPSTICSGESSTLNASCTTGIVKWYNDPSLLSELPSTTVSPLVTTTYYVACVNGLCKSLPASLGVNVSPTPSAPINAAASPSSICVGQSSNLTANCAAGAVAWFSNAALTNVSTSTVSPTATTTYYAVCVVGNCKSPATQVVVGVIPKPSAPSISPSTETICEGTSTTLEASGCTGTVNWYVSGSTSIISTGTSYTASPIVSTNYVAECVNAQGCTSALSNFGAITVVSKPTQPSISVSKKSICAGSSITLTGTNCPSPSILSWFKNGSNVAFATGLNLTDTPTSTTTYSATCGTIGAVSCSNPSNGDLTVTVNALPIAPIISAGTPTICSGQSSVLSGTCGNGELLVWSNGQTGNTITVSPISTTTYTAKCMNSTSGCESGNSLGTTVTVNSVPNAPTNTSASPATICAGNPSTLVANCASGSLVWYSDIALTSVLNSNIVTPTATTTYYAVCTNGTCKSSANPLTVVVDPSICDKSKIAIVKGSALNLGTDGVATPGDIVTYSYDVTNIGNVTLTSVTVTENAAGFTGTGSLPAPTFVSSTLASPAGTLKVGEKATYSATYAITAADILAGKIDNSAFANGISPKGTAVKDTSDSKNPADYNESGIPSDPNGEDKTGTPIAESPKLSIVKGSALNLGTDGVATPGDIVTYSYDVTNIGNVTLTSVSVTENAAGFTGTGTLPAPTFVSSTLASPAGTLKVGEKATYSATYAITAADILAGKIDNSAFANGISPKGTAVKDTSDSKNPADYNESGIPSDPNGEDKTGTPIAESPKLSIVKGSALNLGTDGVATPGDIVTYSYDVTNIGNVTLTSVAVTENASGFTGTGTLPAPTFVSSTLASPAGTLKVGEKATYSATYAITAADILAGKIDNSAFANGISPKGTAVKDTSDSKNPADYNESGIPSDPNGEDKTGTPIAESPKIAIVKGSALNLGTDGVATPGDIVTYSYDVSNIGNVTLTSVTVTENAAGFTGTGTLPAPSFVSSTLASPAGTLKVGEKATYSATYAITAVDILAGKIDNSAFANGISPKGTAVKDTSDSKNPADYNESGVPSDPNGEDKTGTPIAESPKITIVKGSALNLGTDGVATPGDIVTYSYDVTNIGNVTLTSVTVTENAAGFTGTGTLPAPTFVSSTLASPAGTLLVGEKATYSATYAITAADILAGKIDNSAFANGISPKGTAVKDTSDSKNPADYNESGIPSDPNGEDKTGTPIGGSADIAVIKKVNNSLPSKGDQITYTIVAKNTGNTIATNVVISDQIPSGVSFVSATANKGTWSTPKWSIPMLAAGDSAILSIKVNVTGEGVINNTAKLDTLDQKDSNPDNNVSKVCISVPITICQGTTIELSAPQGYTNVVWFKNGTQVAAGNTYQATSTGSYTMSADQGGTCGTTSCCPVRIISEVCCQVICVPISTKKIR